MKWRRRLLERLVYPTLGDLPITMIKRRAIIELLDAIEDGRLNDGLTGQPIKGGPVMAHSTLAVIRRVMHWHAVRDEDFITPVVRGMGRIEPGNRARSRVLTDDELRRVWKAAEERADPFARMLQFILLTASRRNEAARLSWAEIEGTDWVLPAARNKVGFDLRSAVEQGGARLARRAAADRRQAVRLHLRQ